MTISRRDGLKLLGVSAGLSLTGGISATETTTRFPPPPPYRRGFDNQRIPDLGNGFFLNPLISGDHPDPTILKDGADYYMTFSTFDSYPGLVIWHSTDLINWTPRTAALTASSNGVPATRASNC